MSNLSKKCFMPVTIPENILEKAMYELFSGISWRQLTNVTSDVSKPNINMYNSTTMYRHLKTYMASKNVLEKYEQWIHDNKPGGKLVIDEYQNDESELDSVGAEAESTRQADTNDYSALTSSPVVRTFSPIKLKDDEEVQMSIIKKYQDMIMTLVEEKNQLKEKCNNQSRELEEIRADQKDNENVILNQQTAIQMHKEQTNIEKESHRTTKNKLMDTQIELKDIKDELKQHKLESNAKRRKLDEAALNTTYFLSNINK
jgi:hypothetical protein